MPKKPVKQKTKKTVDSSVNNYLNRIETDIKTNQSKVSMVLGALIVLVIGILVFNYYNKSQPSLGPAQQTQGDITQDVSPNNLPGKYTVKDGDTLFIIAEKYYQDGSKFELISKANNLTDVNEIESGQILEIPKSPDSEAQANPTPPPVESSTPQPSSTPIASPSLDNQTDLGTGGGNTTVWGEKIEGSTYTVQEGDWLSTIAARAYGDMYSFKKIVEANNIQNADYITPGQVLKIPR